jgi:hypothetical protein
MEGWAKEYLTFPMRRQGELDGACGLYCILAVAAWWADRKRLEFEEAPYLRAVLEGQGLALQLLGDAKDETKTPLDGLNHNERVGIAETLGLALAELKVGDASAITAHFAFRDEPLIATVKMPFCDPLMRVGEDHYVHTVVIVSARGDELLIADPHPWNKRFSLWKMREFERCRAAAKKFASIEWFEPKASRRASPSG